MRPGRPSRRALSRTGGGLRRLTRLTRLTRRLLVCIGMLVGIGLLGGCRVSLPLAQKRPLGDVKTEAGAYAGDPRWAALCESLPERVGAALERLDTVGGISFPKAQRPLVVLRPFGDESVPYELRARIVDGRRRVILHLNAEPLLAHVKDVDRVLARALTEAAYQDAAQRHGLVPRWMTQLAATAVSGELDQQLMALHRRALEGDRDVLRVDGEDAGAAPQTGVAALVLLTSSGRPDEVRHLMQSVADGDGADAVMARMAHQPDGTWARAAQTALRLRLAAEDAEPWRLLERAEVAFDEAGGAALEAELPAEIPLEVQDEVQVLRARAAADEGDHARAARLLSEMNEDAPAHLRDPAGALALRIRVESRPGGDTALARKLALQLDLDFPRSEARRALRQAHPLLGMEEDPQRWLDTMRQRIVREGTEGLDLGTLERYARTLIFDHRVGAAQRFLDELGERGTAPELAGVRGAAAEAALEPTEAARGRIAERVANWQAAPNEEHAQDVRDSGPPAAPALGSVLAITHGTQRADALRLAADTLGPRDVLLLVGSEWRDNRRFFKRDLDVIAERVPYDALKAHLSVATMRRLGVADPDTQWQRMTLGLSDAWLTAHPQFLMQLRSPTYARRSDAFAQIREQAPREATPALVARGLTDPAALLRRDAAALAGEVGFSALARRGLTDEAWLVREAAARAVAETDGADAIDTLLDFLRTDPSIEVRGAAALGLLEVGAANERVLDALLATQVGEDARLRDAIGTRLAQLDALTVVRAIERGWKRALNRKKPSSGYLFRTSLIYHRLAKQDLGYFPGASTSELRGMVRKIRAWIAVHERGVANPQAGDPPQAGASADVRLLGAGIEAGR